MEGTPVESPVQAHDVDDVDDLRASLEAAYANLVTYERACQALGGISRFTLSRLVRDGKLTAVEVRGRRFISRPSLRDYIEDLRASVDAQVDHRL